MLANRMPMDLHTPMPFAEEVKQLLLLVPSGPPHRLSCSEPVNCLQGQPEGQTAA